MSLIIRPGGRPRAAACTVTGSTAVSWVTGGSSTAAANINLDNIGMDGWPNSNYVLAICVMGVGSTATRSLSTITIAGLGLVIVNKTPGDAGGTCVAIAILDPGNNSALAGGTRTISGVFNSTMNYVRYDVFGLYGVRMDGGVNGMTNDSSVFQGTASAGSVGTGATANVAGGVLLACQANGSGSGSASINGAMTLGTNGVVGTMGISVAYRNATTEATGFSPAFTLNAASVNRSAILVSLR